VLDVKGGLAAMQIVSDVQKSVAIPKLPKTTNKALKHDGAGVLGLSGPNTFYLTLQKKGGLDGKFAAIGKVIAGADRLQGLKKGDQIRSVRITRVGQAARDFKTDDEAFGKLMAARK
jgi:cyclophilin family peptidyl-prolyl cis-trans isomerase